ncbi:MAG TPA: BatD family protein [Thermoanaerobaculia bacterium]|nr:BatD family protein [Thermoanaerobaculia bacterium]
MVLLVLSASPASAGEIRVRATLEPERIGIDETATLSIEVQGGGLRGVHFKPGFELDNLEVVGGPYQHEEILLGIGRVARSVKLSWKLRAISTGRARIQGLRIRVGGEVVSLGTREVLVQDEPTGLSASGEDDRDERDEDDPLDRFFRRWEPAWRDRTWRRPNVFLRAEVRPLKPVVGQQVLYTVYLYTLSDVSAASPTAVPDFQGFWVLDIPQPTKLPTDMVEVEGKRYGRVVLLQKALFPLRPGRHHLQPTEMDLLVRTVERGFFGPPISRPEQLHLRTAAMPIDVQPLPPSPPGFTGAVGQMSLTATVEPRELRLGEAATVTVTLSGEGNLQGLPEPPMPKVEGLKVLPPQQEGEDKISGTKIRGSRTWSYPVVPERAGTYRLEVPGIPYFDPAAKKYELAKVEPIRLTALPALAAKQSEPAAPEAPQLGDGWRDRLPWLLAVPGVLALAVLLARRRNGIGNGKATPCEARRRLEHGLEEAGQESRPRQAAARIEEAWRDFLAERWEIPSGIPSTRWADLLIERNADPGAARELVRLADDLHYLRYAPQLSTCDSMVGEVLDRCRRLLRRL